MRYPDVIGEFETLQAVASGRSLSRYGDGELRACEGSTLKCQDSTPKLQERLREVLLDSGDCLVGIPNIHSKTPKATWQKYTWTARLLANRQYYSAFVSRPDSAPWVNTPEYWALLESVWTGKTLTLVRGSDKSLMASDMTTATSVREVIVPRQHAFARYDEILEEVGTPSLAILCVGPTATVMASDLCRKGVHAIDLGLIGMFLRKHRRGEPMWLDREQKNWKG